jgi:hypothetical protein
MFHRVMRRPLGEAAGRLIMDGFRKNRGLSPPSLPSRRLTLAGAD